MTITPPFPSFICPRTSRVATLFWMPQDGTSSNVIEVLRLTRRARIHLWILSFHLTCALSSILFIANASSVPKRLGQCQETKKKAMPSTHNKTGSHKTATQLLFASDCDLREGGGYIIKLRQVIQSSTGKTPCY